MEASDELRVYWVLSDSDAQITRSALEEVGGKLDEPLRRYEPSDQERDKHAYARFEPLSILVATFAVAFLAQQLSRLAKDQKHSGLIIDLRATPAHISEESTLDRGTVYVIGPDGVLKQVSEPGALDIVAAIRAVRG
jgi:hypothetical protein